MRRFRPLLALAVLLPLLTPTTRADDWPQFRGPAGTGVADAKTPAEWGAEKNVAWKATVPGVAWSCPIVVGDKVFLTTAFSDGQPKPKAGGGEGRGRRLRQGGGAAEGDVPVQGGVPRPRHRQAGVGEGGEGGTAHHPDAQ